MNMMTLHSEQPKRAAIFLDKDGTLIEDVPYNVDAERVRFYPEVMTALAELHARGYLLIVVSNQPGVAKGYFDAAAVEATGELIRSQLSAHGIPLAGFYYCPHHPGGQIVDYAVTCDCRKPLAGLLLRAAEEHHVDLPASWMLGDILNDVEAGKRAGCRTILIGRGNETEWLAGELRNPDHVVQGMDEAVQYIIAQSPAAARES